MTTDNRTIFPLERIAEGVNNLLRKNVYGKLFWIRAEIGKLNYWPKSGCCYPDLLEKKDGLVVAKMQGFIGKQEFTTISGKFLNAVGNPLSDGMKIIFCAYLVYIKTKGLQLNIVDVDIDYSVGDLAKEKYQTVKRLESENLLTKNKTRHLPLLLKRLAVISVETSKGFQDFMAVSQRQKTCPWKVKLFSCHLQGSLAFGDISNALNEISLNSSSYDCVVVVRGGGGDQGLMCYDSYELAKVFANCPLPVFTGIGHSTNNTIVEQVVYKSCISPSELAMFIANYNEQTIYKYKMLVGQIVNKVRNKNNLAKSVLKKSAGQIKSFTTTKSLNSNFRLDNDLLKISSKIKMAPSIERKNLAIVSSKILFTLSEKYNSDKSKFINLYSTTLDEVKAYIKDYSSKLSVIGEKLDSCSLATYMQRGLSIVFFKDKIVTDCKTLKPGDRIEIRLKNGFVNAVITK